MKRNISIGLSVLAIGLLIYGLWVWLKPAPQVDFSADVKPILNKHCITCHGGVKKSGGFSLLFEQDAFTDTESGHPAIVPGDASQSSFIQRLKEKDPELRMPYEKPPLSEAEIKTLTDWVDQGAQWGKHWAYTLPETIQVPSHTQEAGLLDSETSSFIQNEIDHFVLRQLQERQLQPQKQAPKSVLARRVALDITGLPPKPSLFEGYTSGSLSYEQYVDSLLADTAYGEKWASWWLDMARYADSKGYEKDNGRTMWRYRDWVIEAFNSDMPYDQFTVEQLAGDLLPDPSPDQLIATAFHRNTMNNDEGGTEDEEFRVASVIDRVNTTMEVWQSTTIGCVQCHSHTYDPFKHEEYYSLMAFFNNARDEDTPGENPVLKFYKPEQQKQLSQVLDWINAHGDAKTSQLYKDFLNFQEPVYQAHNATNFTNGELADTKWLALWKGGSCVVPNVNTQGGQYLYLNYWSGINGTTMTIRKKDAQGEVLAKFPINDTKGSIIRQIPFKKITEQTDLFFEVENPNIKEQTTTSFISWMAFLPDLPGKGLPGYAQINNSFLELLNTRTPTLPIMAENPPYMARTTQVFERGNWLIKGDTVQPNTPQILNDWKEEWPKNRLGLAQWIVSQENPLTARTAVNRIWHQLFGRGIVASLEDMGTQSTPPTHPELLDWMALEFMDNYQWSMKSLIKEMVLSGTYRQASEISPELYQIDPENQYYARGPRFRLSAEQIRDQALAVSGLLSSKMYGPSVMPPQPDGIWQTVYSGAKWVESKGEDKYRRGLYTYIKRTSPYPSFLTFDAGSREVCTIRRTLTNTPLQALVTLNDPVYIEAAYHLAKQMNDEKDVADAIAKGYTKATYLPISEENKKVLLELYEISMADFNLNPDAASDFLPQEANADARLASLTVVATALLNLDEFLTKA